MAQELSINQVDILSEVTEDLNIIAEEYGEWKRLNLTGLQHLNGVTSNIQTQLNGKSPASHTHTSYAPTSHTHSEYSPTNHTHNMQNYSTSETAIGTWIDGKTLYRKVVKYTTSAKEGTVASGLNTSTIDVVTKLDCVVNCPAGFVTSYCEYCGTDYFRFYLGTDNNFLYKGGTSIPPSPWTLIFTVEYTKK